jgi:hypothetical protein
MSHRFTRVPGVSDSAARNRQSSSSLQLPPVSRIFSGTLNLRRSHITTCDRLPVASVTKIILASNPIHSLFGFPPTSTLTHLELDQTEIATLYGFPSAPNITSISIQGTHLMRHQHARIAVLLVTTPNLRYINGELVTGSERRLTQQYPSECHELVRGGWMPSLPPPQKEDLPIIQKQIVEQRSAGDRVRRSAPGPEPYAKPKPQSQLYAQTLAQQGEEIKRLEGVIAALSR